MLYFLFLLLAGYLVILILFYFFQRGLIYFPTKYTNSPEKSDVPEMEVVELKPEEELTINAWYCPPKNSHLPTLVHFHGNAGNIGDRGFIVRPFIDEGFGVLLTTYRGYSGNPGKPSERGLYQDGRAAMEFLKQKQVSEKQIVLYGDSIGGAVALQLATEFSIGAVILQAPFTSLGQAGQFHYPFFPVKWLIRDKYDNLKKAKNVHAPTLIIHGTEDDIIPTSFGKQLYEALPEPKELILIPGCSHNDLYEPEMLIRFIKTTLKL